jgi:Tfp pilus assembly protein PilW
MRTERHPAGISVIEVMIALGIAVIIVISVGSLIISTHSLDTEASKQLQAVGFAKQWLEVVESKSNYFFQCPVGNTCGTQSCTPRTGFNRCWVQYPPPTGNCANPNFYKIAVDGTLSCVNPSTDTSTDVHPATDFTRTMKVENQPRDTTTGALGSGSEDFNTKKITVTVQWQRAGSTRQVQLSEIVTAWKD